MISIVSRHHVSQKYGAQPARAQGLGPALCFMFLILSSSLSMTNVMASQPTGSSQHDDASAIEATGSALSQAFIHTAQQAKFSIVTITVKKKIAANQGIPTRAPSFDPPFSRGLFGQSSIPKEETPLPDSREVEVTSGIIISADGFILTNQQVVDQAYDVRVQLTDGRVFPAELIGQDQLTNVAILKIPASQLLPLHWGNSNELKVGEMVVAVSNPFGFSQTVTGGLISAVGRANVGFVDLESFVQTDAATNPAHSGGALLNLKGELIGIITAILPENIGTLGIGFAIPSQMAKSVATSLMTHGNVTRGWLGIATQKLTPKLAMSLKTLKVEGVVITDVAKDGPAGLANLKRRDIILSYEGTPINAPRQLQTLIAETNPGTSITIRRLQGGQEKDVAIKIGEFPVESSHRVRLEPGDDPHLLAGVTVEALPKHLSSRKEGVLVFEIVPGSLADKRGLEEGDIILDINQTAIRSVKDFTGLAEKLKRKDTALLLLQRENATMFLPIP